VRRGLVALLVAGAALAATGCGGGGEPVSNRAGADVANGKTLFTGEGRCGSCHTLADAGTTSQVGPDLDQAWAYACRQGFGQDTWFDVVLAQIDLAAAPMPSDLVTGQDAVDVAAYVTQNAGQNVAGCGEATTGGTETGETTTEGG
jgi:cytochrome c6